MSPTRHWLQILAAFALGQTRLLAVKLSQPWALQGHPHHLPVLCLGQVLVNNLCKAQKALWALWAGLPCWRVLYLAQEPWAAHRRQRQGTTKAICWEPPLQALVHWVALPPPSPTQ